MVADIKPSQTELVDDIITDQDKDGLDTKHVEDYDRPQVIEGVDVVVPVSHFATMSRSQAFRTFWRVGRFLLRSRSHTHPTVYDVLFHGVFRRWNGWLSIIARRYVTSTTNVTGRLVDHFQDPS